MLGMEKNITYSVLELCMQEGDGNFRGIKLFDYA